MTADLVATLVIFAFTALAAATPLIFVTLGETLTQRTGVINLGVEGEMLFGACFGFGAAMATGSPWLGLAAGTLAGAGLSLVHAAMVLGARANQIASGLAVWILGLGITSYAGRQFVGGQVTALPRFDVPLLRDTAVLGEGLASAGLAAFLAIGTVLVAAWWLARTRTGLVWRSVGESAAISRENGLNPVWARFWAIVTGGALAGFGGAILSIDYTQTWAQDMTKGQGLVAVGLVIVARWNPILVLPVCFVFGLAQVAAVRLPAAGVELSAYVFLALPYIAVLVVIVLTHAFGHVRSAMPADLRAVFK